SVEGRARRRPDVPATPPPRQPGAARNHRRAEAPASVRGRAEVAPSPVQAPGQSGGRSSGRPASLDGPGSFASAGLPLLRDRGGGGDMPDEAVDLEGDSLVSGPQSKI